MPDAARVLVVEDNPSLNEILRKVLEAEGHEPVAAFTGAEAIEALRSGGPFHLVLLDVMLPDPSAGGRAMDGLEVCRRIKADPGLRDTMVFLLTVKDQPDDIMGGIDAGADDYITKPFNANLLVAKIKAMLRLKTLQDELRAKNLQLERMAVTDGLTGIANHRHFVERLADEVKRGRRYATPLAVLFLDLDGFKKVNDTMGHRHGDGVLREVADRLRVGLRETDLVARYGGDEFALLLPQTDLTGAGRVADQILGRLSEPLVVEGHAHRVGVSLGLVACPPGCVPTADALMVAADQALYRAKSEGGNRVYAMTVEAG